MQRLSPPRSIKQVLIRLTVPLRSIDAASFPLTPSLLPMPAEKPPLLCDHYLDLFYRTIYNFLNFLHRVYPLTPPRLHTPSSTALVPPHIAFSGPISQDLSSLIHLIHLTISHGARRITLHDSWTPFSIPTLQKALQHRSDTSSCLIKELHPDGSETYFHPPEQHSSSPAPPLSNSTTAPSQSPLIITVVHPGAGRGALVRATRRLTAEQADMDIDQLTAWLDASEGMLPSEPDVVVVFRDKHMGNVLYGFPVWQMRLTQIRFSPRPAGELDEDTLLAMVTSAAAAPKRFGR